RVRTATQKESEPMANLFARKPLDKLMHEAEEVGEHSLKRSLGPWNLVALGIGAIIGAGLFVRTAAAIADRAGPSVVIAFIVAGVGCAFAGLCYAEFASLIPVAGSAYTYSYATMGEFVAWIIGWDLILEYAVGAATVSIAWSAYFNRVLDWFGWRIPYEWSHSPFEASARQLHWYPRVAGPLHRSLRVVLRRAERCCHRASFRTRRSGSVGVFWHHCMPARLRMALDFGGGGDSGRLLFGHSRDAARS